MSQNSSLLVQQARDLYNKLVRKVNSGKKLTLEEQLVLLAAQKVLSLAELGDSR